MTQTQVPPTVFLDENVPDKVYELLSAAGIPALQARNILPQASQDPAVLKKCADESWVLVTLDRKDFWRLHWLWTALFTWGISGTDHGGIISVNQAPPLPDEWAAAIINLLNERGEGLVGRLWEWNLTSHAWQEPELRLP